MVCAGAAAPVMAIVEDINARACRMRSLGVFRIGEIVSFDFTLRGAPKLALTGRITSAAENGVRRSYTVTFEDADGRQGDRIAVALDMSRRFSAAHHPDVPTGDALTRSSARVPLDTTVRYAVEGEAARTGRVTNVSTGGILMNSSDDIAVGATIDLQFALPDSEKTLRVRARIVAHQLHSPNYNVAFFQITDDVRMELERFVSLHERRA